MLARSLNTFLNTTRVHATSSVTISPWDDFLDRATREISAYGPRGRLDKVYIKVDMGERQKTLKIWLKRTRDRRGVESTRLEAKDTKKISEAKDRPF